MAGDCEAEKREEAAARRMYPSLFCRHCGVEESQEVYVCLECRRCDRCGCTEDCPDKGLSDAVLD